MGGKFHLKLNIGTRPIANKYREGKMKSTLKRKSKARETVEREAIEVSSVRVAISCLAGGLRAGFSASDLSVGPKCQSVHLLRCTGQHRFLGRRERNGKVAVRFSR